MEENQTVVHAYLTFDGNCREAMTFYREAIGQGKLEFMTFEQLPEEYDLGEEHNDRIMHCSLREGPLSLMASDTMPGHSPELVDGNSVALSIYTKELENAEKIFGNLSDGGTVTMPFEPVFWGGTFGMLTDRYGMNWMVSCEGQKEKAEAA